MLLTVVSILDEKLRVREFNRLLRKKGRDDDAMLTVKWELPINLSGTILDIETDGLGADSKVICIGYVKGNELIQRVIESEEDELDRVLELCDPVWAYYAPFERKFFPDLEIHDLCTKRIAKDKLVSTNESLSGDELIGSDVPAEFIQYCKTGNVECIDRILRHNRNCLIKELSIHLFQGLKD